MMTISLKQSGSGGWSVCRCQITLFRDLQLGAAIKLAREVARDEHQRVGRQVNVEMPGMLSSVVLACYADPRREVGTAQMMAA